MQPILSAHIQSSRPVAWVKGDHSNCRRKSGEVTKITDCHHHSHDTCISHVELSSLRHARRKLEYSLLVVYTINIFSSQFRALKGDERV